MKTKISMLMIACASLLLTACSSAPSEGDMKEALDRTVEGMPGMEFVEVESFGCKSGEEDAYLCDVKVQFRTPFTQGVQTRPGRLRMVKVGDMWVATQVG
jgi:hypothetical protein